MTRHARRHRLVGFLATLAVLAIAAGLPVLLLAIDAHPIPDTMPSLDTLNDSLLTPDDGTLILAALEVVAWTAWAFMTLSMFLELDARLRGVRPPRLPGLALPQTAARGLIGAAALLFIAAPVVTGAPPATGSTTTQTTVVAHSAPAAGDTAHPSRAPTAETGRNEKSPTTAPTRPHTVRAGESLWSIAAHHLGDGSRFKEIANLNRDVVGDKPGFLRPGWVLQVPAEDTGAVATASYTVKAGDTLGTIARNTLGDADRYMEIFHASAGLTQNDGGTLTNPNLIRAGWTLKRHGFDAAPV